MILNIESRRIDSLTLSSRLYDNAIEYVNSLALKYKKAGLSIYQPDRASYAMCMPKAAKSLSEYTYDEHKTELASTKQNTAHMICLYVYLSSAYNDTPIDGLEIELYGYVYAGKDRLCISTLTEVDYAPLMSSVLTYMPALKAVCECPIDELPLHLSADAMISRIISYRLCKSCRLPIAHNYC